jgi:hypothetical protein
MQKFWPILLLLCCGKLHAQDRLIQRIVDAPVTRLPLYKNIQQPGILAIPLRCDYAGHIINDADPMIDWSNMQVLAVELVFTDYPSHLDLKALNTRRLQQLFVRFPALKNNASIDWQLIRQTDGAEKAAAQQLFHGFVVYARPRQSMAAMAIDSAKLSSLLTPKPVIRPRRLGFLATDTTRLREMYEIEPYTIVKKMKVREALEYLNMEPSLIRKYPGIDSILVFEKPTSDSTETVLRRDPPEDSTVIKVLDRMRWQRMLVVADVTASMYPYTGQLLLWLQLHEDERRIYQCVFFNDGDNKDEADKQPGRTGGIYATGSSVFEEVEKLLYRAMSRGSGGAIPENNLEALLYGIETCPSCTEAVMIVDNHSNVADMSLLPLVKKPVHIIACGVINKINPDYLNIARSTGGSVHLAETDLQNLAALPEGAVLTIGRYRYRVKNGKLVDNE